MGLLESVLGGGSPSFGMLGGSRSGGMSPIALALLGAPAYRTLKGKGRLADILGTNKSEGAAPPNDTAPTLGGILSANSITGGLGRLLNRFRQNGHGETAESWITTGANKAISPNQLETALGAERMEWLLSQTGLSKQELLDGLSKSLPVAVDKLTPEGRLPTQQEAAKWF